MIEVNVCRQISRLVREIAEKTTGAPPDAITLGEYVFIFQPAPTGEVLARLRRHERKHIEQQIRCAPNWANWLPESFRVALGAPKFYRNYIAAYRKSGYDNIYEREAIRAE